jgi:predicted RNA binding protein YcfA (HicA-like mRNA interferase family)
MKRRDLIRHVQRHGCILLREGANHSVYANPVRGKLSTIPRHGENKPFSGA